MKLNELLETVDEDDRVSILIIGESTTLFEGASADFARNSEKFTVARTEAFENELLIGVRRSE